MPLKLVISQKVAPDFQHCENIHCLNPLPDMPIQGSSISAANKDMMSKI